MEHPHEMLPPIHENNLAREDRLALTEFQRELADFIKLIAAIHSRQQNEPVKPLDNGN